MRCRGLHFIIGGFFIVWITCLYLFHVNAMGNELIDDIQTVIEDNNGYISSLEEDNENTGILLSDTFGDIETMTEEETQNSSDPDEENMEYDNFKIMVIFCFGLTAGVVVGHFLTGFIK